MLQRALEIDGPTCRPGNAPQKPFAEADHATARIGALRDADKHLEDEGEDGDDCVGAEKHRRALCHRLSPEPLAACSLSARIWASFDIAAALARGAAFRGGEGFEATGSGA